MSAKRVIAISNIANVKLLRFSIYLWCICLFPVVAKAQFMDRSISYSEAMRLNPALTGIGYTQKAQLYYRHKGQIQQAMYQLMHADYAHYSNRQHMALGISIDNHQMYERLLSEQHIALSYAYRLRLNHNSYLQMALQSKLCQHSLHWQNLRFADQYNEIGELVFPTAEQAPTQLSYRYADFSSGWAILWREKWLIGSSIEHLSRPLSGFYEHSRTALAWHWRSHIATTFRLWQSNKNNFELLLNPHFIYQQQEKNKQIQIGAYLNANPAVIGTWYRQNNGESKTVSIMFGLNYKSIIFAYAYDIAITTDKYAALQSHAISISYTVKQNMKRRYRHKKTLLPIPLF